jgi:histidinol-phosphate aminotransferase
MSVTRRGFLSSLGTPSGALRNGLVDARFIAARGLEAEAAEAWQQGGGRRGGAGNAGGQQSQPPSIKISSNENPMGPGQAVLDAIVAQFGEAGRYPFNAKMGDRKLLEGIAAHVKVKPENVVLGAGSQEILKTAVWAFTSPARHLVTASPTFENATGTARRMGHPVVEIKVDSQFRLDLEGMLTQVRGAGLVFVNNPNNPTATVHNAKTITDFVERVRRISPDTVILIDEAYHEYVTDPAYETAIPLAMATPNVFVARTFSKAFGMAGMRIGYAVGSPDTIKPLARYAMPYNISVLGVAAGLAAIGDAKHMEAERARNTEVRSFTQKVLEDLGCRCTASQANFLFVDVGRPASEFRTACAAQGIGVGRDFPPFEGSHARISLGTMAEMQKAAAVFRDVLRPANNSAGGGGR